MKFNLSKSNGSFRVRFTLDGTRHDFRPGTKDPAVAAAIVRQMTYEWDAGLFDQTLDRYKVKKRDSQINLPAQSQTPKLIDLWEKWVQWAEVSLETYNNTHAWLERVIRQHDPDWNETEWFLQTYADNSASTFNRYRSKLKSCVGHALDAGIVTGGNPYALIKPKKSKGKGNHVKPFTREEIRLILDALQSDRFVHPCSPYTHSHYVPFVKMMFATGLRLGEIAGLTWDCIDLENNQLIIKQSLGKDFGFSHTTSRKIIKTTKTGIVNYLPINTTIRQIISNLERSNCSNYVFIGQRNNSYIDIASFRRYVWTPVLKALGIKYRYPYQSRHTVLSEIASKHGLLAASRVAGHKSVEMVSRHYARFTGDVELPDLFDT
jgi:integrase